MNYAVLLSGGTGTRTGSDMPKQYVWVNGHMMVTYALKPMLDSDHVDKVYVVCADEWREDMIKDVEAAGLDVKKITGFALPGETRQLSILNGLKRIMEETASNRVDDVNRRVSPDTVLIHDAARPFLTADLLDRCYKALDTDAGTDGVMPVLPMKDTVYLSEDGKNISGLIDRNTLFAGQAPELFRLESYYEANLKLLPDEIFKINGASEPAVMAGMKITMIPGDEKNTKVTSPGDLKKYIEEMQG